MLSSIHAFSVELRLASESVLSKVKYVVYKDKNRLLFVVLLPTTSRFVREKFTMQIRTGRMGKERARKERLRGNYLFPREFPSLARFVSCPIFLMRLPRTLR